MTDQPIPADNGNSDAEGAQARPDQPRPDAAGNPPLITDAPSAPPVPGEQPYHVPTAHEQAWSVAQQYPFHPQNPPYQQGNAFGQSAGYGQQAPYGQPAHDVYGQPAYGGYGGQPPHAGYGPYAALPDGQQPGFWTPPPVAGKSRPHKLLYGSVAAAVATALAVGGVALAVDHANRGSSQQTALTTPNQVDPFSQNGTGNGLGSNGSGGNGSGGTGSTVGSTGTTGTATTAQQVGIVDINTTLDYGQGKAAGTCMVLTADVEIRTNNHVVQDSTSISVVVISTGKIYTATVVGTDPTDDVAVLQLKDASGLATAKLGDSSTLTAGTAVTAVGNAGGTGGMPTPATGTVSALNQSITASDDNGSNAEKLTGMIQIAANIQAGDSGGPLYENAGGTIIGMDTAASASSGSTGRFGNQSGTSAATVGFAIPIAKATGIADQIESGTETSTIHIGYPAFLGVQLSAAAAQAQTGGATIGGVIKGSGAAKAGLSAGDTITSLDGKAIASATALSAATASHQPGDKVKIGYTDSSGSSHTVTVTLGGGPAD
ncbi:MAG: trypsin-like peptidase domain-containing protein [Jatrophihabitans sp.]